MRTLLLLYQLHLILSGIRSQRSPALGDWVPWIPKDEPPSKFLLSPPKNRLHPESRTPSWARLWTLSSMPSIYGSDTPTGKPDPWKKEPKSLYLDTLLPIRIP